MSVRGFLRYCLMAKGAWQVLSNMQGWRRSFEEGRPLDAAGDPVPWYTYPAIEYLRNLDFKTCRVFEFGSGNSSFFWAERAAEVFSVENDPAWAEEVRARSVANLNVITALGKEEYVAALSAQPGQFDVVIVDGRHRLACAMAAVEKISERGMIVFDNADWYPGACRELRARGWFQLDFSGLGPINAYAWTTSIFIKADLQFSHVERFSPVGGNPGGEV